MDFLRSRAAKSFFELSSQGGHLPPSLLSHLAPRCWGDEFYKQAVYLGRPVLYIRGALHMAETYGDQPEDELLWLLLYLLELSSEGHLRISRGEIAEDLPSRYPLGGEVFESLERLIKGNPRLFSPGENSSAPVFYDSEGFYLLKMRRMEENFLREFGSLLSRTYPLNPEDETLLTETFEDLRLQTPWSLGENSLLGARLLVSSPFGIITGGPGTGKTTLLSGLLGIYLAFLEKKGSGLARVRLCAPTGRAAKRINETMKGLFQRWPQALDREAETIHKMLGLVPGKIPTYRSGRPLPAEVVVVDEASMVDVPLMTRLIAALKEGSRLLLIGDKDQLPSVEAGALISDLLYGSENPRHRLAGKVLALQRVYRNSGAILEASRLVIRGDQKGFLSFLKRGEISMEGGRFFYRPLEDLKSLVETLVEPFKTQIPKRGGFPVPVAQWGERKKEIDALFALHRQSIVLTPTRKGLFGAPYLNRAIQEALVGQGQEEFHGQPLLIDRNDYEHSLYNGDRGVIFRFKEGLYAFFEDPWGGYRFFPLLLLEAWETAFVLTIHKSQGSEFQRVHILLPEGAERLLSREILYTAITRGQEEVTLYGREEIVSLALQRGVYRLSGIRRFMMLP